MKELKPVQEQLRWMHLYMLRSIDAAAEAKERDRLRGALLPWIKKNCEQDENGNYYYEFPEPICIEDVWYSGLQVQRRVSEYVDDNKVLDYLVSTDLWDKCTYTETRRLVDMDAVYAANQDGSIPDEIIDSFIETDETWALVKVKK